MFRCGGSKWVTGGTKHVNCVVKAERKKGHTLRKGRKT
jgi:hypothetical protein